MPTTSPGRGDALRLDRRAFIGAGLALPAALWLASCGGDDSSSGLPGSATIRPRFPRDILVPGNVRMPISFEDGGALLGTGPDTITASVLADDGSTVLAEGLTASRIQLDQQQTAFWAVRAEIANPGIYALQVDGIDEPMAFQVMEPDQVVVPGTGDPMRPVDTPTLDDARGVNPICTRTDGVCPLHDITLTEALGLGKPIAFLVSTPAHCQFGVCGPVLEVLLDAHETYGDRVAMVHADVYTDDSAQTTTEAVGAYDMSWEPSLWIADATGTIVDRFDITYSPDELDAALVAAGA